MPSLVTDSGLFDTIAGLPVHPLVVHVAVIVLPLSAAAFIVLVVMRRWRRTFGWLAVLGLVVGAGAALVAKESGEALAKRVGTPATHASYGDVLPLLGILLAVVAVAWLVLQRRAIAGSIAGSVAGSVSGKAAPGTTPSAPGRDSGAVAVVGWLGVLVALGTLGLTVLVGHSGAEAVWGSRIAATNPLPAGAGQGGTPVPVATSAPTSGTKASATPGGAGSTATGAAGGYTMAQVQQHASATSCWTVVNGGVFDLTSWITQHPGGEAVIKGLCGIDGTKAFVAQHGSLGKAVNQLKQFKIGTLA